MHPSSTGMVATKPVENGKPPAVPPIVVPDKATEVARNASVPAGSFDQVAYRMLARSRVIGVLACAVLAGSPAVADCTLRSEVPDDWLNRIPVSEEACTNGSSTAKELAQASIRSDRLRFEE